MRSVKRSDKHEEMVRRLAEQPHPAANRSVFPTMRELMCFAATLGFEHDKRRPLEGKTQEIDARIFQGNQQAVDLLYLLALAGTKDAEILREDREDDAVTVFEEYANGGFEVLRGWLSEKADDLNGDRAILAALAKYGYLSDPDVAGGDASEVTF
jgi:dnd system-associated protein 4